MSQLAGRCSPILGGGPSVNGPRRAEIRPQSRRDLAHFRSSRLWRAMAFREPFKAARDHWEKLFLDCSRRYTGNLSLFNKTPVRFFCSISSSGVQDNRFVRHTSEGETEPSSYTWPDNQRPRVCILGGGFGGLYTALRLESLVWPDDRKPQVLLVDQSDRFVFKPLLYELLSGEVDDWEIAPSFTDLLRNTSVQFVKDRVELLRPLDHLNRIEMREPGRSRSGGLVQLESGIIIEYDWSLPRCCGISFFIMTLYLSIFLIVISIVLCLSILLFTAILQRKFLFFHKSKCPQQICSVSLFTLRFCNLKRNDH